MTVGILLLIGFIFGFLIGALFIAIQWEDAERQDREARR